jgi:hypothetical protein
MLIRLTVSDDLAFYIGIKGHVAQSIYRDKELFLRCNSSSKHRMDLAPSEGRARKPQSAPRQPVWQQKDRMKA